MMMIETFTYEFMQRALVAGVVAAVLCGVIGIYVILNRIVFIGGGIAHTAFGGIGLGYLLGMDPLLFAVLFSVAAALGIGAISDRSKVSEDTAIGVF
ncbi:MAG TPA: metal ABC transporter permease, partial [Methanothrix sp.]|nr:metal ABC transporter permease [Methanothrix sp.]